MKYTLHKPLVDGPRLITDVAIREPSAREALALARGATGDEYNDAVAVVACITGLSTKLLDTQLGGRDFLALSKIAASVFTEEPT